MINIRVFQLKLRMKGGKTVYVTKERSGPDHLLKIASRPNKERSLFIMDRRTSTIRLAVSPTLAVSNQFGRGMKLGGNVVLRKYDGSPTQIAYINEHHRVLNKAGDCLTPHFYKNEEDNNLTWWHCNSQKAQKWNFRFQTYLFRRSVELPKTRLHAVQVTSSNNADDFYQDPWAATYKKNLKKSWEPRPKKVKTGELNYRRGKYDIHRIHRTGARRYNKYPVHDRAFRSIYKHVDLPRLGRGFKTTYRDIFNLRKQRQQP